jgi:hypothetical protein
VSPLLKYSVLRLALFVVSLVTFRALGARGILSVVLAAFVSMLLSYVLLRGPRDELTGAIERRVSDRLERAGGAGPVSAAARRRAEDDAIEAAAADVERGRPGDQRSEPASAEGQPDPEQ